MAIKMIIILFILLHLEMNCRGGRPVAFRPRDNFFRRHELAWTNAEVGLKNRKQRCVQEPHDKNKNVI